MGIWSVGPLRLIFQSIVLLHLPRCHIQACACAQRCACEQNCVRNFANEVVTCEGTTHLERGSAETHLLIECVAASSALLYSGLCVRTALCMRTKLCAQFATSVKK